MDLRSNTRAVLGRRGRWLRGTVSHAVLTLAAATLLAASASADVNSGQTVQMSSLSGTVTMNGGTVQIDSSKTWSNDWNLKATSGSTIDNKGATTTLSGKFSGAGSITIADSACASGSTCTLTITNSSSDLTGSVAIGSGATVAMTGTATLATAAGITVDGTLDISGMDSSTSIIALAGGGKISLGTLTLTLTDATGGNFSGVISGTGSLVLTTGSQTLSGINTYTGATSVSGGTLSLVGAGSIAASSSVTVYGALDFSQANSATIASLSGSGSVVLGSNNLVLTNASGVFTGVISGSGGVIVQSGTQYLGGADTFTGGATVTGGTLQLGSDTLSYNVANSGTVSFYSASTSTMNGIVSGTGAVTKIGYGVTTITAAQTYAGSTTISSGTLKLTSNGSLATSSGVEVDSILDLTEASNAAIKSLSGFGTVRLGAMSLTVTNGVSTVDFSGAITGTGGITIAGGTQSFSGANTYTGATTINSGATLDLVIGATLTSKVVDNGALALTTGVTSTGYVVVNSLSGTGTVALNTNTLELSAASDTFSGALSGSGGLWLVSGNETLSGNSTYTGTTTVSAGTLTLTGSLATASKLAINGTFDASGAAGTALTFGALSGSGSVVMGTHQLVVGAATGVFSGVISGSGGVAVTGGTLTLSGVNTYTGGTTIGTNGTLQIGNGGSSGSILGDITDNGILRFYRLDSSTYSGVVSGTGSVEQGGIGTTILSNDNTYSGGTTITSGTLQIGNGGNSGSILGDVVDNGTLAFNRSGAVTINAGISGVGGSLSIVGGQITLVGNSTYTGVTTIASGASLALAGTTSIATSANLTNDGTFDISGLPGNTSIKALFGTNTAADVELGTNTLTITNASGVYAGAINGTGGLTLTAGSQTLSGVSTYSGATTLNGGTLTVTGSIANSTVQVNSGATLAGSGTVGGVSVASGGKLKAGTSGSGTLTVNGNVTLASGSTFAVDVTSAGAGKLAASGTASLNGALAITSSDGTYELGNQITVLTASNITYGASFPSTYSFTGDNQAVFKTALVETSTALKVTIDLDQLSPVLANTTATANQKSVAAGIDKAIAGGTNLPAAIENLGNDTSDQLMAATTQLSGELGADTPLAAQAVFNPFLDAMAARTNMQRPITRGSVQPVEAWVDGYRGSDIVKGDVDGDGSHKFHANVTGVAAGLQWAPWAHTVIGAAIAADTSDFRLADDLGHGTATSMQAGAYGFIQLSRHFYNAFEAGVGVTQIKTTRTLSVPAADTLTAKLTALSFGGRYEAGVQTALFTPYVGVQDQLTMLPSYTESGTITSDPFALKYASKTANAGRAELGLRYQLDVDVTPRWILTPDFTLHLNNRLAYAYDLSDGSAASASFASVAKSDFTVFGAKNGRQGGLGSFGVDVLFNNGVRVESHVDTAITTRSAAFTGFVSAGYTW